MKKSRQLAPIMMTTYSRLAHLKRCISALKANTLAKDSTLYITSDGPKPGDEERVNAVRTYILNIDGFKNIIPMFRKVNDRLQNWAVRQQILEKHGKLIFQEEDCETSPFYLEFMNHCLKRFQSDKEIFSVHAYCPPVRYFRNLPCSLVALPRFSAWGFGIWADSNRQIRTSISKEEYLHLLHDRTFLKKASRECGLSLIKLFQLIADGKLLAYDAMANLAIIRNAQTAIYPTRSLIRNFGLDGSGEHCAKTIKFDTKIIQELDLNDFREKPINSIRAKWEMAHFYSNGWKGRIKFLSKRLRGKYNLD